jgi:predicted kinase
LGAAPGAVVLRTDEIRKRLMGVSPLERLPPAAYTAKMGERVYAEMFAIAGRVLAAGKAVVLDAVFLQPAERDAAEAVAKAAGAPFQGLWLQGAAPLLKARLAKRSGDASDARPVTLDEQLVRDPGPIGWPVAGAADLDAAADRILLTTHRN